MLKVVIFGWLVRGSRSHYSDPTAAPDHRLSFLELRARRGAGGKLWAGGGAWCRDSSPWLASSGQLRGARVFPAKKGYG